ncbi:hypothetical protein [Photorhabdus heterorhabditis]|uniref:Type VI secretion protein n=1 Tax=Photorhabdus heterorhabditis TaxID=880156 RepID=A0A5B0WAK6_9GAMM|nr:hypothetical protein [Photorhabdus heterorhabditis]KAA1183151.1 hypothetical protein F0L16_16175 [Photorhabdus heterorhabditis]KOY60522.1 hypothetical protein AM629_18845 [Photorhabdus heterorhabditis]
MPVDMSAIPILAERKPGPIIKRWLIALMIFISLGGCATVVYWPASVPIHTPWFWCCFLVFPFLAWAGAFGIRCLCYQICQIWSDSWDYEREVCFYQETQRGQRYLNVLAHVVDLPQTVMTGSLATQLMAQKAVLPSWVDMAHGQVVRQIRFAMPERPSRERLYEKMAALLADEALTTALRQLSIHYTVFSSLQIDAGLDAAEYEAVWQSVWEASGIRTPLSILPGTGLAIIDGWLDTSRHNAVLLVVAIRLVTEVMDGQGDTAVALLLNSTPIRQSTLFVPQREPISTVQATIHRPELTQDDDMKYALSQALLWADIPSESIHQLWFSGMGCDNQSQAISTLLIDQLPNVGEQAERQCDIDVQTGFTGIASPWLAAAVAIDAVTSQKQAQLVMSTPAPDRLIPWFMVIKPVETQEAV